MRMRKLPGFCHPSPRESTNFPFLIPTTTKGKCLDLNHRIKGPECAILAICLVEPKKGQLG